MTFQNDFNPFRAICALLSAPHHLYKTNLHIQIFVFGDLFKWKSGNAGYILLRSKAEPISAIQSSSQTQLPAYFNSQGFMLVCLRRYIISCKTGLPNTKPYGHDPFSAILLLDVCEHDWEKKTHR